MKLHKISYESSTKILSEGFILRRSTWIKAANPQNPKKTKDTFYIIFMSTWPPHAFNEKIFRINQEFVLETYVVK